MALWMNQDAVVYPRGTTHHMGDAIMETPTCDSGDLDIAYGAEPTLVIPEKAKCSSTPKRFRHMIPFAFLEVGFKGRVIRVGFALDLNMSLNGRATSEQQSHFVRYAFVVVRFAEERPVIVSLLLKIFLFEPAGIFLLVPSSGPLPQTDEDTTVHASKDAFTYHVPVIVGPAPYFGI